MTTTDAQVRKLVGEMTKHGKKGVDAMRSGMDRKTARKYLRVGKLPSEMKNPRTWRTRKDPFEADWESIVKRLKDAPELEAKALFENLLEANPGIYHPGQLRTFQRRVHRWRAQEGLDREVFFPQEHHPGEAMQTDFTWMTKLEISIGGEPFPHMLCHVVLPYSNWEWASICRSESLAALKRGVQAAVFQLGYVPRNHQTDNSTAATHDLATGKRGFNADYLALMRHFGMEPRTIEVGKKEQNGDIESSHGVLKRRLQQQLLLRGSRDFDSLEQYERWLETVLEQANRLRQKRFAEELAIMRPFSAARLPEYTEESVGVGKGSTIRVKRNTYSVPSRLIGETVRVRIFDGRLEIYFAGDLQVTVERLLGRNGHWINYRHVIWSLVRKPGAFERYRYREELFPSVAFRRAYDTLVEHSATRRKADVEYLRLLHLAAATMEHEVEKALNRLFALGLAPTFSKVKGMVAPEHPQLPELSPPTVDLTSYDGLLEERREVVR